MAKQKSVLYAVYGTLRKDGSNRFYLDDKNVKFIGHYITEPIYTMYDLGAYPGLKKDGIHSINLEIYRVRSKDVEEGIDNLEGYDSKDEKNSFYKKDIIQTPFGPAFIYFYNSHDLKGYDIVESGDWIEYEEKFNNV